MCTKVTNFAQMNPPNFHGSKLDEDVKQFVDEEHTVLAFKEVTSEDKEGLTAYQLK